MNLSQTTEILGRYPKRPPVLSPEQAAAREKFMMRWHQVLPRRYQAIERFNHGFPAKLPFKQGCKTLEIGAGIGEHLRHQDRVNQDYYCLDYREEFCKELRKLIPSDHVICGDIQKKQPFEDKSFDRILAIHVLEHLPDLPSALNEIKRLLKPGGFFDVLIPCEGEFMYSVARKISAERLFRREFKMDYTPIVRNEHVSTYYEVRSILNCDFDVVKQSMFPFYLPFPSINLVEGIRLIPKKAGIA